MEDYRKLDQLHTTELVVTRKGLFRAVYTLTDGQFNYGQLSCNGMFNRDKNIETAGERWIIRPVGFWCKETLIINADKSEVVGKITRNNWGTKTSLEMNNGFNALLKRGKGFFSRKMNWTNEQYGDQIEITSCSKYSRPFTVHLDPATLKNTLSVALITLIGVHLVVVRQAQAAAVV
jgi:hypothetical protein